ncbi:YlaF family protein [Neobacillus fumarioli]|uniref:YlaF family protein n=1 Tax=Neobacillus fumarioli TaxID=105229 RepID=UPI00082D71F6|nr:YlaF family protein [Neobacillus fumarioli]
MNRVKWPMLIYAILAAASIIGIGVAIAEKSFLGVLGCIAAVIIIMGLGFSTKKKMRERGQL